MPALTACNGVSTKDNPCFNGREAVIEAVSDAIKRSRTLRLNVRVGATTSSGSMDL